MGHWTNLGKHFLFGSSVKTGTRAIIRPLLCLVPVFALETSNEQLPKFIQTDNASSSIKKGSMTLSAFSHVFWKLAYLIIVVDVITLPDAVLRLSPQISLLANLPSAYLFFCNLDNDTSFLIENCINFKDRPYTRGGIICLDGYASSSIKMASELILNPDNINSQFPNSGQNIPLILCCVILSLVVVSAANF